RGNLQPSNKNKYIGLFLFVKLAIDRWLSTALISLSNRGDRRHIVDLRTMALRRNGVVATALARLNYYSRNRFTAPPRARTIRPRGPRSLPPPAPCRALSRRQGRRPHSRSSSTPCRRPWRRAVPPWPWLRHASFFRASR